MGLFEHFPYTNYHDLNLDKILERTAEAEQAVADSAADAQQAAADAAAIHGEATTALNTANAALAAATNAVNTANAANTAAGNAVSTANAANTAAGNAVNTANTANTKATNAVNTANTASSNASNALNTANLALAQTTIEHYNVLMDTSDPADITFNYAGTDDDIANGISAGTIRFLSALPAAGAKYAIPCSIKSSGLFDTSRIVHAISTYVDNGYLCVDDYTFNFSRSTNSDPWTYDGGTKSSYTVALTSV